MNESQINALLITLASIVLAIPIAWWIGTYISYSLDSIKYEFGKYTEAYRCKRCNKIHRIPRDICAKCGHQHKEPFSMKEEVGKWHCKLSKLNLVYLWEPKEDKK